MMLWSTIRQAHGKKTKSDRKKDELDNVKHMAGIAKKSFNEPDEVRNPKEKMTIEAVEVNGLKLQRNTAGPGYAGHDCEIHHFLYVISGKLNARMPGGAEVEFGPGDIGVIPAGHDAWNAGNESVRWLELPQ